MKARSLSDITDAELNDKEGTARRELEKLAAYLAAQFPDAKGNDLANACRKALDDPFSFMSWWAESEYAALERQFPMLELAVRANIAAGTVTIARAARAAKVTT
jgi:hypothetical protein